MKFRCKCDYVISDQTDFIPYKAYILADQDREDFQESEPRALFDFVRPAYQCSGCGRLWIEDQTGSLKSFMPDSPADGILSSKKAGVWKAQLRGSWTENTRAPVNGKPGTLWCSTAIRGGGLLETFGQWQDLQRRYFEEFEKRQSLGMLRDATLSKQGETIHQWSFGAV